MNQEIPMLSWSITEWHSSKKSSGIPVTKWLISFLELDTKEFAHLDNLMNFKKYYCTLISPWWRLMNSFTLASFFSLGKNLSRTTLLNTSQVIGPALKALLSLHWVYQVWAISLRLYKDSSTFSFEVNPIYHRRLCRSNQGCLKDPHLHKTQRTFECSLLWSLSSKKS